MEMVMMRVIWSPLVWIICISIYAIAILLHWTILRREIKSRIQNQTSFATKWLKIFSIGCIISGFLVPLFNGLSWTPGGCYFSALIGSVMTATQFCFMGYYQLSRLYYCFANAKIYSDKGYPNWIFPIMYIIGPLANITWIGGSIFYDNGTISNKCGINRDYEFYQESIAIDNDNQQPIQIIAFTGGAMVPLWDVITLCLYIFKVRQFKDYTNGNEIVGERILFILRKTLFLTLCYEICTLLMILTLLIWHIMISGDIRSTFESVFHSVISLSLSYTMLLMMNYNTKDYVKFLIFLKKYRLYYLCCCYGSIVTKQLEISQTADSDEPNMVKKQTITTMHTLKTDVGTQRNGNELSIETKTVVEP